MSFLALSSPLAFAMLGGVGLLIVLLYLLKAGTQRITVASNFIWRQLQTTRRPRLDRWRWWLSLLLALTIGLSVALALTRPQAPFVGGVAQRLVLVLDNSASMAARGSDGKSRWQHALERARGIILNAGLASQFMLLDTVGRAATPDWLTRDAALAQLNALTASTSGIARMPVVPVGEQIESIVFTDGVARLDLPQDVKIDSVFTPADNVAITAFDAMPSPSDPMRYQALVQLFNASPSAKQVHLALTGENGFALERDLNIPAGATVNQTLDVSDCPAGILRAETRMPSDGFDLDNTAYAVVAPHLAKRILLVTPGNRHLQDSLKLLPGIQLTVNTPAQYRASLDYDAYVFDRFAPPLAPRRGTLLFRPPPTRWLPAFQNAASNPTITRWDESHPLAANVSWRDLQVRRAVLAKFSASKQQSDVVWAKGSGEHPLVTAINQAPRSVTVGFALDDSNFAMQSSFPIFLGTALAWLTDVAPPRAHGLGAIEIPYANAKVTRFDGKLLTTINGAHTTVFDAAQPGVFTVTSDAGVEQFVANVIDPQFSDINRSRFAVEPQRLARSFGATRFGFEPWVALLVFAVALLAFEWVTFTRRATI
jgi:Aerotolerance regulator N-terminal